MCDEDIEVQTNSKRSRKFTKYFWRQLFVSSGLWTPFVAVGVMVGTPTVYIPQVRKEANSTEVLSVEMTSWLTSAFSYAGIPWCFVLAFLAGHIGRKRTFIIVALNQTLVATSFYLTMTPTHMLITQLLHGLTGGGSLTVCIMSLVEYTSPKYRGLMLTIKSASVFWAILATNAIGTFAPWKYISILGFLNAFYSLTVFLWPESPTWLATQGRYDECRKSHRWLKGCDDNSEQELEILTTTQMKVREGTKKRTARDKFLFATEREFWYPMLLSFLMILIYQLSGKLVVTLYAIDIIKTITMSELAAYRGMLILDGVSVFAMYIGCMLSKLYRRRMMLFTFGSSAVLFLVSMSLYLYLIHLRYFQQNTYISLFLLVGFSLSIGLGPLILTTSLYAELIPLRYKGQATVIFACMFMIVQSTILKNTPNIMKLLNMHGMFLFYGISVSICLIILYKYLPETKDKTLQEIEEYFTSKTSY